MIDPVLKRTVAYERQPPTGRPLRVLKCKVCREVFGCYDILAGRQDLYCHHCRTVNKFTFGGGKYTQEIEPDLT